MSLKRIAFIFLTLCFVIGNQSCFKHRRQLRVKNTFSIPVDVVVGPVDYGSVKTGKTTAYQDIPKGHLDISGGIEGSMEVPTGKHLYTLWINSSGVVTLTEDSK
jgi:hypothetical protein